MLKKLFLLILLISVLGVHSSFAQEEPPLPFGLEEERIEEPGLPLGLESDQNEEPGLPEGLTLDDADIDKKDIYLDSEVSPLPFDLTGFAEMRAGIRTQNDSYQDDASIGEGRLQLEMEKGWEEINFKLTTDFLYDPVVNRHDIRLEEGEGWLDLRETFISLTPVDFIDLKIGRQILTWGTGDLLFINDLFPKDWNSFFIGRDTEYLKAPSDAVKTSLFTDLANIDVIYTPRFDADRFIDGRRISYWNSMLGRQAGKDDILKVDKPNDWFEDDEMAFRLYNNVRGYELAAYAYDGFWKSPGGQDPNTGEVIFPELSVYGASIRGPLWQGISNIEFGFYDSRDDSGGDDPFIRNSECRIMIGYEQEIFTDFTATVQYYLEYMTDYNSYRDTLPPGSPEADEDRHLITLRLTKLLFNQNLKLSLFGYYSPSDDDSYLRPLIHYKVTDDWSAEAGGNVFLGAHRHTFFGQFENNSNIYTAIRYSF